MAQNDNQTRLRNADNLAKILKNIPKDVQEQVTKSMQNAVNRVQKNSSRDVVELTGDLKKSIEARNIDDDEHRWGIFANFYWLWVEFGTVKMQAQPFFMSHWRKAKKTVQNSIKRNIKAKIKQKYGKR